MWKWMIVLSVLSFGACFFAVKSLVGGVDKVLRVPESRPIISPVENRVDSTQTTFLDENKIIDKVEAQQQKYYESLPKPENSPVPENPSLTTEPKTLRTPSPAVVPSEPNKPQEIPKVPPTTPTPESSTPPPNQPTGSNPLKVFTSPDESTNKTTDELFGNQ